MNKEGDECRDEVTAGLKKEGKNSSGGGGGTYGSDYKPVMSCTSGNQSAGGARRGPVCRLQRPWWVPASVSTLRPSPRCHGNHPSDPQKLLVVLVLLRPARR